MQALMHFIALQGEMAPKDEFIHTVGVSVVGYEDSVNQDAIHTATPSQDWPTPL